MHSTRQVMFRKVLNGILINIISTSRKVLLDFTATAFQWTQQAYKTVTWLNPSGHVIDTA